MADSLSRIESKEEVKDYLTKLNYLLENGAKITFQIERKVDTMKDTKFTNKYTVAELFPNENPENALRRELKKLTVENYMRTVKDNRFPKRSEMREFGKVYDGYGDVYIKNQGRAFFTRKQWRSSYVCYVFPFCRKTVS